ncbi:tetraketide alpha-pyrone reductase 2-like isoform X1 [Chenopodium quinoa]|uniref:NAD-dependent epimerase/dehydratase domain-containing protein n=1 Tax=Chenopodium quinoa TaxID=63459 RepID=A0A803KV20_CHEQI|nr:tetraketide alpha-pyrone reductase 2-like isoform X1 [Chenopodium quinoa]
MPSYCVTGATGFIASYLVKSLLLQGNTVRATVRDPDNVEKVGFLWELQGAKERLTLYKADLLIDGSFDDAINGVLGVFHTACPVFLPSQTDDVQTLLIDPGIKGTLNVLSSCKKANSVKRVVLTSSCSAIRYRDDASLVSPLNESHWSDPEYCKRYNTLGEMAAWEVAKESGLDLVAVNPSFVVGPLLTSQPTSTLELILSLTKGALGEYPKLVIGFVHIDDVIAAHILAMEETKASGRLIYSSSVAHWSDIMKMLKDKYPMYPFECKQGSTEGNDFPHSMDTSKIMQLGFPGFKSIPQMFDDCIKSFQEKGFL